LALMPVMAEVITFEPGVVDPFGPLVQIGSTYPGITFTNVAWIEAFNATGTRIFPGETDPRDFDTGARGLAGIYSDDQGNTATPTFSSRMRIEFSGLQSAIGLLAYDVGSAGVVVLALDSNNQTIAAQSAFHPDSMEMQGTGYGDYFWFVRQSADIHALELYQPNPDGNDGFLIDNLSLGEVPEPTSFVLLGGALLAFGLYRRNRA
jgi:hypothetical protein